MNTLRSRADFDVDVLVVGGGPAGVALALRLQRLGYDVLLVAPQTRRFGSSHEFETLAPAAQGQLHVLGLQSALEAARRTRVEFEIRWGSDRFEARAPSDLIDRNAFLAALRKLALDADVQVWDGGVDAFRRTECGWRVTLTSTGGPREAKTRSLVDATGRRGLFSSRSRRGPALVAIHAIWSGEDLPQKLRVAAGPQAWVWGAPASDGRYVTTVFQDPREAKREGQDLNERVNRAVVEAGALIGASRLVLLELTGVSDATPQMKDAYDGRGFFRVGDAVLAVDPLSSSGVQTALQSASDTALAIHTLRHDPKATTLAATFLNSRLERRRARHAAWAAAFYREGATRFPDVFWTERAGSARNDMAEANAEAPAPLPPPDQPVALDSAIRIEPEACAVGDLIELRGAVNHPSLAEPVVFVAGIEISHLLAQVAPGSKARSLVRDWSRHVGEDSAVRIFSWAWRNRLIFPSSARLP
jgi:flavin-dependent dehydrogenase